MAKAATLSRRSRDSSFGGWPEQILLGILLLAIALAGAIVFLIATGLLDADQIIADDDLRSTLLGFAEGGTGTERLMTAGASAVIGLGSLVILFRRFGTESRGAIPGAIAAQHILLADDEGMVMVATDGIASVAEAAAVRSHGVIDADVRVSGRGSAPVRIRVVGHVYAGADLKRAGRETRENVKSAIERLVGLEVTDVTVEIVVSEEVGREVA